MSAVKIKIPEDNITTFLMMKNHFKKIYNVKCRVNCWSEPRPSNRSIKNEYFDIRDSRVLPHYCNSTISSTAKKSKNVNRSLSKKKRLNRNLSYDSTISTFNNDENFAIGSDEYNRPKSTDYSKDRCLDKKKFFQNTIDDTNDSYQLFLEEMTNEILKLNLYTNKALTNVFQKHIKHNIGKLEKKKMLSEVKKIQLFLDLPSDKEDII